jgi:hypothetical protein
MLNGNIVAENTVLIPPSADQLRMKSTKTMLALSAGKGIVSFAEARPSAIRPKRKGKILQPVVLVDLQRKGPGAAKKQASADLTLFTCCLFFYRCS